MINKALLPISIVALSLFFSCEKHINIRDLETSEQTVLNHNKDNTPFLLPIVWMADEDALSANLAKRTSAVKSVVSENDKIVFTNIENAKTNLKNLLAAYKNNAVIVFVEPSMNNVASLMQENSLLHLYPQTDDYLFYAISRTGGSYGLRKPEKCTVVGTEEDVEGAEAAVVPSEEDINGEWKDPYEEYDANDPAYYLGPLVRWINGVVHPYTKSSTSIIQKNSCDYREDIPWVCDLFVHNCGAGSSDDRIQGTFYAGYHYCVTPVFSQGYDPDPDKMPGDYYKFNTVYFLDPHNVWKGAPEESCNAHGGIYVHIMGAFMRDISFKTYILGDGNKPNFYCQPQPGTDNTQVNYDETDGFSLDGGVTAGVTGGKETATASFSWGYDHSSTVRQTVSDVSISNFSQMYDVDFNNNEIGSSVAWKFKFGNLPEPSGDKGFSRNCPESAYSYQSFPTQWVWNTNSQKVGSTASVGTLVTEITPVLGGCHNGYCVTGQNNTWELETMRSYLALIAPNRIIFGSGNIVNDLGDKYVIHDFVIYEHNEQTAVYSNTTDLMYNKGLEFSLPVGEYDIVAKVWNSNTNRDKDYILEGYEVVRRLDDKVNDISFKRNFKEK